MKYFLVAIAITGLLSCGEQSENSDNSSADDNEAFVAFDLSNLDTTVNPCENFYQYAIGGWLKANPIPNSESRWSSFNVVNDSNNVKLKKILTEFSSGEYEKGSIEQQIGDFYKSIMDSAQADAQKSMPLMEELDRIENATKKEDLITLLSHQKSIGINSLFSIYVGQDDKASDQYITFLSQSGLGLPDQAYYIKAGERSDEIRAAYKKYMQNTLELAGLENAKQIANDAYTIEDYLAKHSMTRVERRDPEKTYNKYAISQLTSDFSNIDWQTYFKTLNLAPIENVVIAQPNFFSAVNKLLDTASVEAIQNYMRWRLFDTYSGELSQDFIDERFAFYGTALSGTKEMRPRWKRALSKINGQIGQLLGKSFVERHFSEQAKEDVGQMVEHLRAVFQERIMKLEWMSDETKLKAIEKLKAFNKKIGYPDKWRDYSELVIVENNQVQNIMNARKFNFNYMLHKLGKEIDKDEWFMNPQTVNAYYSSSKNEIVFPAGILQPPFYSVAADDAINYGGIGAVIGHEFTHGFDDQGSKYDAVGNLENWWTEDDRNLFEERADLVVDQFNQYEPLDSLFVNGKLTLGENIADLGGATLSYYAMQKQLEDKSVKKIDGFTPEQRFFLGWAQVWHMNMTDEELRKRIATDSHSPGQYRVVGPLSNMKEFANAFGCGQDDPMVNPDSTRAEIW